VFLGLLLWLFRGRATLEDVRGRDTVPVTSLEGAIGVLLYGMLAELGGERWRVISVGLLVVSVCSRSSRQCCRFDTFLRGADGQQR
jgi:hypothetical protein